MTMRRKAAVAGVTGEERMVAEIFLAADTIWTDAASVTKPRNADALTRFQPFDARPKQINPANNFVPGNDWNFRVRQFAIHDMQIGAAHTTGSHLYANLARSRLGIGEFCPFKGSTNFL
jgi:hypothetical protein